MSSPGKPCLVSSSRSSSSTRSSSSSSSIMSTLFRKTTMAGTSHLAGQQDVLARLGHRAVRRGDHQDGAVHLGGAGDHVLDVVGVAGAVDVGVVAVLRLVLDVLNGDRDAASALFRRVVDAREVAVGGQLLEGQHLRDRRGQRCLAMVDVTDGADVEVRLRSLEFLLWPCRLLLLSYLRRLLRRTVVSAVAPAILRVRSSAPLPDCLRWSPQSDSNR